MESEVLGACTVQHGNNEAIQQEFEGDTKEHKRKKQHTKGIALL
jgi:hypothetical protein